jgi:S1-C subfamily serine protease/WD40 repeat protein
MSPRLWFVGMFFLICASRCCVAVGAETRLEMVPLGKGLTVAAMSLTEDGKYLVAAAPEANAVIVFDVRSGAEVKRITTDSPHVLLCRGDLAFVADVDGRLAAFSETNGWAQSGQVGLAEPAVSLAAGWGNGFRQEVIAVVGKEKTARRVIDVDVSTWTARALCEPREIDAAEVSRDGLNLLLQAHLDQTPGGIPEAYSLAEFKRAGAAARSLGKSDYGSYRFLYQSATSDTWFGHVEAYVGTPPKRTYIDAANGIVLPDALRPAAYSLRADVLTALDISAGMTSVGTAPVAFQIPNAARVFHSNWAWGVFPRAAAVTLDADLFVFFYSDPEKTIFRGKMPAFARAADAAGGSGDRAFEPLPSTETIDSIAATEDGQFLVAAHESANLITIWDIRTGREVARETCPSPSFVLCRGTRAYVASAENGTIRIFKEADAWKVEDEVQVGSKGVYYLSAAGGEHFDGRVLATCQAEHGTQHFLVDCKRDAHVQTKASSGWIATINYSGRKVLVQTTGSGGAPDDYDLQDFVAGGRPGPRLPAAPNGYPFLFQVREGDAWFGGRTMYADFGVKAAPLGVVAVPDRMRDVVYGLGRGTLAAWRANAALAPSGSCTARTPAFLAQFASEVEPVIGGRNGGWRRLEDWKGYAHSAGHKGSGRFFQPIAVTLGDTVYLVLHDPSSRAVYRCAVPLSAFSASPVVASVPGTGPAGATTVATGPTKLPTEQAVTTIALTEDGQFLLAAHESANQISIWDVRRGVCTKTITCPSPRSILCRGGHAFVANYGQGRITVLDPAKDWAAIGACAVGEPDVFYLSAPQGKFFANQILATCGKYHHRVVVLVDVASASRSARLVERENLGAATVDYRGTAVIEQREFDWETMGYPQAFDYTVYLRGNAVAAGPALERRMGLLTQPWPDSLWFDDSEAAAGWPPKTVLPPPMKDLRTKAGLVVPDQFQPVFYRLESDGIHFRTASAPLVDGARVATDLPDWACRPADRARPSTADTRIVPDDVFANPVAVTLDGRAYVFAVHGGAVYRFSGAVPAGAAQPPVASATSLPPTGLAPASATSGEPGNLKLLADPTFVGRLRDGSGILLLQGASLSLLDADGRAVTHATLLPVAYRKILDRPEYYVALLGNGIDLLDRRTFAVIRHVELGGIVGAGGTRDLALHPTEPRCYVSVADGEAMLAGGADAEVPRVAEIDERTGAVQYLRHVYGERLRVDAAGRQLAAWIPMHSVSVDPAWELGGISKWLSAPPLMRPAVFAFYQLDHNGARLLTSAENIGPELSPRQDAIALAGSGVVREYPVRALREPTATYHAVSGAQPIVFDYHPRLDIIAVNDDTGVTLYDRATGQPRAGGRIDCKGISRILFTPSGRSVCIVSRPAGSADWALSSHPLSLTPAEERTLATAAPAATGEFDVVDDEPELPNGTTEVRDMQALHLTAQGSAMSARAVNQRYVQSVVLVGPGQPNFTGVAVGSRGYVVTCAEAIHTGTNQLWVRMSTPRHQPYASAGAVQVVRIDPARDLALLKVPTAFEVIPPLTNAAPEAGEPLTLLANAGTDFNGIHGLSVLTGTVSNPAETIHGVRYLQTTVAGGSGALGAPLFDGKGAVIGLLVHRTRKEGISFAVPASDIRQFLTECTIPPPATSIKPRAATRPAAPSGAEIAEENRRRAVQQATGRGPGGSSSDGPANGQLSARPMPAKNSPAITATEVLWEKGVTGGTFFTSPDGEHVGWVQIDPRRIGQPGSSQGVLDGARKPFNNLGVFSEDSKHVLYFVAGGAVGKLDTLRYVLDGAPPRIASDPPANGRPIAFASGGGHVAWVGVKVGQWSEFAVIDGVPGKPYQHLLCEPSFSPDGAHYAYAASDVSHTLVVRDGRETSYDAQSGTGAVISVAGHIALVLRERNQLQGHADYDGTAQKPYDQVDGVKLSDDGKHVGYIAMMGGRRFVVIDGEEKDVPVGVPQSLEFGPGGRWACLGGQNSAQLLLDGVPQGPADVQPVGRPEITFSHDGNHIAYLVDRQASSETPVLGARPLRPLRRQVVLDGALQPLPDEQGSATGPLTFSPDGQRLAYVVQFMAQPAFGPDGRPLTGYAAVPRPVQRLVVDGVPTDTFNEIRPPVFSADGKHWACFAKRSGHDPIGRDDEWYVVLDGAPAPCRRPLAKVPFLDSHNILRGYTAGPEQGAWHLTDVYRLDVRSK